MSTIAAQAPKDLDKDDENAVTVVYVCGDCGEDQRVKPGDTIMCRDCGYRILYKKRTRRVVQYEAR